MILLHSHSVDTTAKIVKPPLTLCLSTNKLHIVCFKISYLKLTK